MPRDGEAHPQICLSPQLGCCKAIAGLLYLPMIKTFTPVNKDFRQGGTSWVPWCECQHSCHLGFAADGESRGQRCQGQRVRLFATPPGSSLCGIFWARILECVAIPFSRRLNPGLLHWRQIIYHLRHQGGLEGGRVTVKTSVLHFLFCPGVCRWSKVGFWSLIRSLSLLFSR